MGQLKLIARYISAWLRQSWHGPVVLAVAVLIGFGWWVMPRRIEQLVPVDGSNLWTADSAPPRREVIWKSAESIQSMLREERSTQGRYAAAFSDGGATLFFNRNTANGAEIYQTHLRNGRWETPMPLESINTTADEFGPAVSADGQRLYFYSNRPGGLGRYDIYVSEHSDDGWSEPQNLGPTINTVDNEIEPAIAPDGVTLVYSSDRAAADDSNNNSGEIDAWSNTLRSTVAAASFDLFVARRDSVDSDWQDAAAIESINRPDSNEGAPVIAPNGAFLYFASNRTIGDESPNLDLYRSRIVGVNFREPENLGPSINTDANETEPAISPEGFRLVFSSNREGDEGLYVSTAEEVFRQSGWDTSRLDSLGSVWGRALVITMVLIVIVLTAVFSRGWIIEKATTAKFFFCSIVIHILLILILMKWMLPRVIEEIVTKLHEADPSTQLFDDNQHQSHEDGKEAYEKLADLKSLDPVESPDLIRQTTDAISVPQRTDDPIPTVTAERARRMPTEDVLYIPPKKQVVAKRSTEPVTMPVDRTKAAPLTPVDVTELPDEPLPTETLPQETPVADTETALNRQKQEIQRQPMQRREETVPNLKRKTLDISQVRPTEKVDLADATANISRTKQRENEVVVNAPTADPPNIDAEQPKNVDPLQSATANVVRSTVNPLQRPKDLNAPLPRSVAKVRNVVVEAADTSEPSADNATTPSETSQLQRRDTGVPIVGVSVSEPEPATLTENTAPAEIMVEKAESELNRSETVAPKPGLGDVASLPRKASQPTAASKVEVTIAKVERPTGPTVFDQKPIANRAQTKPEVKALETEEQVNLPVPAETIEKTQSKPVDQATEISKLDRADVDALAPARPVSDAVTSTPMKRPMTPSAVERAITTVDQDRSKPNAPMKQLERRVTQAIVEENDVQSNAETVNELAATEQPTEQAVFGIESSLARADQRLPVAPTRTPPELTGPSTKTSHRINVGSLNEKAYNAPPTFGEHVSRLNRRRAKATRVLMAEDNIGLRSLFTLRQGDTRKQYIELFGGTQQSEAAVNRGLLWLVTHQNADGSWSLENFHANCKGKHANCPGAGKVRSNTAATGLALLPLLAAGNTHIEGQYKKSVAGGLKWLMDHQKDNGDLLGPGDTQRMYSHGIAAIALCEACGMTEDAELKKAATKALDFIVKAQHGPTGGWRYNPNEAADTSVVGWQMMALKSGEMAGIPVPKATLANAARWLKSVEAKPDGGMFGYNSRGASPAMTAEGLLCLQFMNTERNSNRMRSGADFLLKFLPRSDQRNTSYYWYYGTQVMYHMQGQYWEAWNEKLRDELVKSQVKSGQLTGTWNPRDNWENSGGRIYATSMKLLMLEVYYRHLPLYEQLED